MKTGVPLGTLVGSTTFLVHINDFRRDYDMAKYVDDATVWGRCASTK